MAQFSPADLALYKQIVGNAAIETGKVIAEIDANLPSKSYFDFSGQQAAAFKVMNEQKEYQKAQLYPLALEFSGSSTGNMFGRPASPAEVQNLLSQFKESIRWYKQAAEQAAKNSTYAKFKNLVAGSATKLGEVSGSISNAVDKLGELVKQGYEAAKDTATGPKEEVLSPPPPPTPKKVFPWGWVIGGTVGVLALGGGIYWYMQKRRRDQLTAPLQGVVLPHHLALAPKRRRRSRR